MDVSRVKLAIRSAFITNGFTVGALIARLPDFKIRFDLTTGEVGRLLFCSAFGVLLTLGFIGKIIAKNGSRPIAIIGSLYSALALIPIALANSVPLFAVALFIWGSAITVQDVAMNSHAATLEHETGRKLMSGFHAIFSCGALLGGFSGGIASQLSITISKQCFLVAICFLIIVTLFKSYWLPSGIDQHPYEEKKKHKRPAIFFFIGLLGLASTVNEGAAGDWGGILARETFGATPFLATLPYIFFNVAMVTGRFSGDYLMERFGTYKILFRAGLITGIGLSTGLIIGNICSQILAWFAIGAGMSVVIPAVFSTGANIARDRFAGKIAPSEGVAIVSGISYFGFLAAPPTLGYIAQAITLRWAMLIPAALAIALAFGSRALKN